MKGEIPNGREKKIACAKKSRYVVVGLIRANLGQKFAYFNMPRYKKTKTKVGFTQRYSKTQ